MTEPKKKDAGPPRPAPLDRYYAHGIKHARRLGSQLRGEKTGTEEEKAEGLYNEAVGYRFGSAPYCGTGLPLKNPRCGFNQSAFILRANSLYWQTAWTVNVPE